MSPRYRRPGFDPGRIDRAARLYEELGTVRKVAKAMNVGTTTAYRYLELAGVMPLEKERKEPSHG